MRHMKHACGENIKGVYARPFSAFQTRRQISLTPLHAHEQNDNRFDQAYSFRKAYLAATKLREKQDAWCGEALSLALSLVCIS